jgi:cullin-associated NEDD8-dissociated protein 1
MSHALPQRSELLATFYRSLFPTLSSRLSEREESVRLEIFASLSTLLRQTSVLVQDGRRAQEKAGERALARGMSPGTLKRKRQESEEGVRDVEMEEPEVEVVDDTCVAA